MVACGGTHVDERLRPNRQPQKAVETLLQEVPQPAVCEGVEGMGWGWGGVMPCPAMQWCRLGGLANCGKLPPCMHPICTDGPAWGLLGRPSASLIYAPESTSHQKKIQKKRSHRFHHCDDSSPGSRDPLLCRTLHTHMLSTKTSTPHPSLPPLLRLLCPLSVDRTVPQNRALSTLPLTQLSGTHNDSVKCTGVQIFPQSRPERYRGVWAI